MSEQFISEIFFLCKPSKDGVLDEQKVGAVNRMLSRLYMQHADEMNAPPPEPFPEAAVRFSIFRSQLHRALVQFDAQSKERLLQYLADEALRPVSEAPFFAEAVGPACEAPRDIIQDEMPSAEAMQTYTDGIPVTGPPGHAGRHRKLPACGCGLDAPQLPGLEQLQMPGLNLEAIQASGPYQGAARLATAQYEGASKGVERWLSTAQESETGKQTLKAWGAAKESEMGRQTLEVGQHTLEAAKVYGNLAVESSAQALGQVRGLDWSALAAKPWTEHMLAGQTAALAMLRQLGPEQVEKEKREEMQRDVDLASQHEQEAQRLPPVSTQPHWQQEKPKPLPGRNVSWNSASTAAGSALTSQVSNFSDPLLQDSASQRAEGACPRFGLGSLGSAVQQHEQPAVQPRQAVVRQSSAYSQQSEQPSRKKSLWRFDAGDGAHINIRKAPQINGPHAGGILQPGETFEVSREWLGADNILFLQLADGRGWLFEAKPGVGKMCTRADNLIPDGH